MALTRLTSLIAITVLPLAATAQLTSADATYAKFRMARQQNIGRSDGLLAMQRSVGLHPGTYAVGSAADCVVKEEHLPAHSGSLIVDAAGAVILHQETRSDEVLPVSSLSDLHLSTTKGWVHRESVSFAAAPIPGGAQVLIKDSENPAVKSYPGLRWFPPSSAWKITATWTPYLTAHPLAISLRSGRIVQEPAVGYASFKLGEQNFQLDAVEDDGHLFFVIGDMTNGVTSYGGGRFIENAVASHGMHEKGVVILDLNDLVNPYCAYSKGQNCPRPTKANTLPIKINAGEMQFPGEPE